MLVGLQNYKFQEYFVVSKITRVLFQNGHIDNDLTEML